ncbi:MAG: 50S ribosomal protein L24 [Chloroflexota bacterium]|nr:50S ribosomal protein L24 [Chloroflexota bacterium]
MPMNIKKGDTVEVIAGDYLKKRGTVRRVLPKEGRAVVSGVNLVKKHQRQMPTGGRGQAQGGIIEFEAPIHISNVMLVCPTCKKPTRVAYDKSSGAKIRICKLCRAEID